MTRIKEHKHLLLLLTSVLLLTAQPLARGLLAELLLFDGLALVFLFTIVLVVFERHRERLVSLLLAGPALACTWAGHVLAGTPQVVAWIIFHFFVILFLGFAVIVILRDLFEREIIRGDEIVGVVCGYMLAGLAWGNLYLLAERLLPGSFRFHPDLADQLADEYRRRTLFNYFSFTTLTTLGYGDIIPITPAVCSLAWLEAVFGQFYVAVVVAQLVGLRLAQARSLPASKSESSPPGDGNSS